MSTVPTGTVTFLFTDIEGSTNLSQQFPAEWESLRDRHHAILHQAIQVHDGYVFQIVGDEFCVAFHTAIDAVRAAADAQRMLFSEPWKTAPIKVRMGIHSGTALSGSDADRSGGYTGYNALSRSSRLMSVGHGGQVLVSLATEELVRDELPEGIGLRDLGPRRLKDLIRPEQIFQLIIPGLPVDFPPIKTLDAYRHNLPIQLTSFIGREKELTAVRQAIIDHRLVTLTGAGGSGKTRLSLHVAADLLDQFPNGVWFVELASLTNPDLIPQTILSAFGVGDQPGMTSLQLLTDYVRERKLLLVLDNCEHLITEAAKLVTTLLTSAENLRILATSREALGVDGEVSWYMPSLSIPDVKHLPAPEGLSQYEAVSLFIDRAILAQPHFTVTKHNAPAIAQICYRLDGIPLAIELAAARVKALDVDQISKRLDDRFHLLTGRSRTALPRHQTLRATIDWSYELLSEQEKILFRRLAVFAGGWTLEAAEQICSTEEDKLDVLELLPHLVDKSLVVMDEWAGEARYHLLETTWQYANETLKASGENKSIRDRHGDWYEKMAEKFRKESFGPNEMYWTHQLNKNLDNLRLALEWFFDGGGSRLVGVKMVSNLADYWGCGGYNNELLYWLDRAEKEDCDQTLLPARATILFFHGSHMGYLGKWKESRLLLEESLAILRELGKPDIATLLALGNTLYYGEASKETGYAYIQEAIELSRDTGNKAVQGIVLRSFSGLKLYEGDITSAIAIAEEAAELFRACESHLDVATCIKIIGSSYLALGNFQGARNCFQDAINMMQKFGYEGGNIAVMLESLGEACRCLDDYIEAEACYRKCLIMGKETGILSKEFIPINLHLGYTVLYQGDYLQAIALFQEALRLSKQWEDIESMVNCLTGFAAVIAVENKTADAAILYGVVDAQVRQIIANGKRFENLFPPADRRELDRYQGLCRSKLGDAAYEAALERGRKLTLEEAIALVLEKIDDQ